MSTKHNPYELGLEQNAANYAALTPLSFIERAAFVYPEQTATVHGQVRRNWAETYTRCRQLASALQARYRKRRYSLSSCTEPAGSF